MPSLLEIAHTVVSASLKPGQAAIDATLGNGHDTLFLAQCVGESGRVFGFDIQAQAITATRQRLQQHGLEHTADLYQLSHAGMLTVIPERYQQNIHAVMFNLGYLPGGDKTLITQSLTTLPAIEAACLLLADSGVITVLAYPGHAGGEEETEQLAAKCREIAGRPGYSTQLISSEYQTAKAPQLFVIRKRPHLL